MPSRAHRQVERGARRLRAWLARITRRRSGMPAPQVLLQAPGLEFGFGDLAQPFHSASVGKVMTATLIAMLAEDGRLSFATPIGALLPPADFSGLPAAPGVDVAAEVTVEHLLTHTSGLPDFFEPPGGGETACSIEEVATDRDRRWTPSDLLGEARRLPAVARPGELFHYSDTGYILLGRIAEEVTGEPFAALVRERLFEPSDMVRSSTPFDAEHAPEDLAGLDIAPLWIGDHELSRAQCMSIDWAGGGVVTTADDLVRFQRALHGGRLISPALLDHLTRPRHRFRRGIHYGAGTMTLRFGEFVPLLRGLPQPIGHVGILATHMFYYPQQDAHVVLNFHSTREMNRSFATHLRIARLVAKLAWTPSALSPQAAGVSWSS